MNRSLLFSILAGITLFLIPYSSAAQDLNKRIFSSEAEQEILVGPGNRAGMEKEPFKKWFDQEYGSYQLNDSLVHILKGTHLSDMQVMVILGTWCSDSRREVPRFYKVADGIKIPDDQIKVIYVDRDKKVPADDSLKYSVTRVPTFIFSIYGKEINRIVETPEDSFEKEFKKLCGIIHTKKFYKNQRAKWEGGNVY